MRAAQAFLMMLTVLFLASAMSLAPAEAFPSPFAVNVVPKGATAGKAPRHAGHYGAGPRPSRWCGWWMRTQLGGGPQYNLARNWAHWGRPANGPRVGAVVVWAHHVGMITGRTANGQWIVKSGNDGGRVRERPRSVAGAVFRVG
jgi:hypothetical protein